MNKKPKGMTLSYILISIILYLLNIYRYNFTKKNPWITVEIFNIDFIVVNYIEELYIIYIRSLFEYENRNCDFYIIYVNTNVY